MWSVQQANIFAWFAKTEMADEPNLIVRARAGTGKTTTIVEGINRAPEAKILLCAFNKKNAIDLQASITNPNAEAKTTHSLGFGFVLRNWRVKADFGMGRAETLADAVCGNRCPDPVKTLVAKLHTKGREICPFARTLGDLTALQLKFELEPDEEFAAQGFDSEYVEARAIEAMELAASVKPVDGIIDGADMLFLPVRNGWMTKQFDLVVGDEAQDMTLTQLALLKGVCRGRLCFVGDDRQAMYDFRGAASDALDRLKDELNAAELGLTTTYRCGQVIVELAKTLVSDFQCGPQNPVGEILELPMEKLRGEATNGDFILSRTNAPLVGVAMKLLRDGKRARVAGRDIGKGLIVIVRKLAKGRAANSVPMFIDKVINWQERESARLQPMLNNKKTKSIGEAKIEMVRDQADMLISLAEGALSVKDIENRIDSLFTDDGLGSKGVITCSSVHRSKGLEADRVFVLRDTLRSNNQEELNIQYVAITRARLTLVWVNKDSN